MIRALNDIMSFDHVIEVLPDGTVTDAPTALHGPELNDDVLDTEPGESWSLFTYGYSGQWGYRGPIMHPSEFIGGRLERDILAQPGYYVALVNHIVPTDEDGEDDIDGWAVAYMESPASIAAES